MASSVSRPWIRGLLRPDTRVGVDTYDHDNSTATQQGPKPGSAEPQQATSLGLDPLGDMAANTKLRIETVKGGMPGIQGAQYVWWELGDNPADVRYWDPPVWVSGFEFIDRTTTANRWRLPHVIKLRSGTLLAAATYDTTGVHVLRRSASAVAWTDLGSPGATYTGTGVLPCPTLVELPSGRVLLLQFRDEATSTGYQLAGWYTDDEGTTWTEQGGNLLASSLSTITTTPRRLRAAYLDQRIVLFGHLEHVTAGEDQVFQWASVDLGNRFSHVSTLDGAANHGYVEVIAHRGRLYVAMLEFDSLLVTAAHVPYLRILGNAYDPIEDAERILMTPTSDTMEWATRAAGLFTAGDLALWGDEDGALWCMGRDLDSLGANEVTVRRSLDEGATWVAPGDGPAAHAGVSVVRSEDAATYPRQFSVVSCFGEAVVLSTHAANPGTADDSLCCWTLGGFTDTRVTASSDIFPDDDYDRWGFISTWFPFDAPEDTIYTLGTVGAPTVTATSTGRRIQTVGGEAVRWDVSGFTATLAEGARVLIECRVGSGDNTKVEIRLSDATPLHYEVHAIVEDGQLRLYDAIAAADIGTVTTTDAVSGQVQVMLQLTSTGAVCRYCVRTNGQDRSWINVGSGAPTSAAANPGNRIRFGAGENTDTTYRWWGYTYGAWMGTPALTARTYSTLPIYVKGGTSIQAKDGPTSIGDIWHIDTAYDFPVDHLDPMVHPSPDVPWRSVVDNVELDLEWEVDAADSRLLGALASAALIGANIGTAELWFKTAGVWAKDVDLDLRAGTSLRYTRDGQVVLPDNSAGGELTHYLPHHASAGMTFKLSATKLRKVARQSSGAWTLGGSSLEPRFQLDGVDGTEPTSGTGGELWVKDYAAVFVPAAAFTHVRLRIPAQRTADGYYEIGKFLLGEFYAFGRDPASNRGLEISPIYELREGQTGQRRVRRRNRARRAVEMAWTDPQLATDIQKDKPDPVWLEGWDAASPPPIAAPAAVLYDLRGLLDDLGGAFTPVVILPRVPLLDDAADVEHLRHPEHLLYSRCMTQTLRLDVGTGNEWSNEDLRSGRVRWDEEL